MATALPLFHLYGDPPDDQAFDFIHVETIASRSSIHDWTIRAHRHRNLFQILLIEQRRRRDDRSKRRSCRSRRRPRFSFLPPWRTDFAFEPNVTRGWVHELHRGRRRPRSPTARARRCRVCARWPCIRSSRLAARTRSASRLSALCAELFEEGSLAREGYRLAMRGLLALIAIGVARLAASRARTGSVTLQPADATVAQLRTLVDEYLPHASGSSASMPRSSA